MNNFIEKLKTSKSLQIKCAAVILAVIVLITGLSLIINSANTIKITDYVMVKEIKGYDGYGTITYEIDAISFAKKLIGNKDIEDIPGAALAFATEETAKDLFDIQIENNGSLSNGDTAKIEVKFKSMHNFGKKIKDGAITQKISGLEEAKVIDLFEKIEVSFGGINGEGRISTLAPNYDKNTEFWLNSVKCEIENDGKLSNDDKVTVTAIVDANSYETLKQRCLNKGYILPEKQEKEYTVKNLSTYMAKADIDDTFLNNIEEQAKTLVDNIFTKIRSVSLYWGDNISSDKKGPAVFAIVNYFSAGECTRCIGFYDCYKTADKTVSTYSYYDQINLGTFVYTAISEEEVLTKIKAQYPNCTLTKIK